jgi:hypothetical protein
VHKHCKNRLKQKGKWDKVLQYNYGYQLKQVS